MFPKLVNVVANFSLKCEFDLMTLKSQLNSANVSYEPKKFGALVIRLKKPKCTMLVFKNGSVTITGAANEKVSKISAFFLAAFLTGKNYNVSVEDYKIVNMVATFDVSEISTGNKETKLDLAELYKLNLASALYEPELFPAYSCVFNGVKLMVFNSGKINFIGAKNMFQIMEAFESFMPILFNSKMLE
jgi:transcription initiation factor TFIID TATA-box-binding protein